MQGVPLPLQVQETIQMLLLCNAAELRFVFFIYVAHYALCQLKLTCDAAHFNF